MQKIQLLLLFIIGFTSFTVAQDIKIITDTTITKQSSVTVKGKTINYTVETGMMPVYKDNKVVASVHYTYYKKNNTKNNQRPILFSFNGGPGSASVWMHIAYTGPKLLNIDDEGYPVQPYGIRDNHYSVLDETDLVYVNPVNTGYSRLVKDAEGKYADRKYFFGINADARYLADWMGTFVSRKNRWESPKYIIGESYGGTRVMALAHELQNRQWMYLNGVIMVSPADYKVLRVGGPVSSALNLPYYTATAWHHKLLPAKLQEKDLSTLLPEVEAFTINELIPAITKGGFISEQERNRVAEKMAKYSSLDKKYILQQNLDVPTSFFWKELLRDEKGQVIGRLDSRYIGVDKVETGTRPEYNPELSSWLHSFTPAINYYLRSELGLQTDLKYNMFGDVHPWDMENDNVRNNLRRAMAANPYLNVMIQSGYYDGATTYFAAKYTMWQIDPSGKFKDRLSFKGYRSGHMMYLRDEDLQLATDDIRSFILKTKNQQKPAKFE